MIVALQMRDDWCEHLIVPDGVDIKAAVAAYGEWYENEFGYGKAVYVGIVDWLQDKVNARVATDAEIIELYDYLPWNPENNWTPEKQKIIDENKRKRQLVTNE